MFKRITSATVLIVLSTTLLWLSLRLGQTSTVLFSTGLLLASAVLGFRDMRSTKVTYLFENQLLKLISIIVPLGSIGLCFFVLIADVTHTNSLEKLLHNILVSLPEPPPLVYSELVSLLALAYLLFGARFSSQITKAK